MAASFPLALAASVVGCFARHDSQDPGENAGEGHVSVPFDVDAGVRDVEPRPTTGPGSAASTSAAPDPVYGGGATGVTDPVSGDAGRHAGGGDATAGRDAFAFAVPDAATCDDSVDGVRGGHVYPSHGGAVACLDEYPCTNFARVVKPRLRDALDTCLATADGRLCFADLTPTSERRRCYAEVVRQACDDPTAVTFCRSLRASACANRPDAGSRLAGCEREVALLDAVGRRELAACVTRTACSDEAMDDCRFFYLGR